MSVFFKSCANGYSRVDVTVSRCRACSISVEVARPGADGQAVSRYVLRRVVPFHKAARVVERAIMGRGDCRVIPSGASGFIITHTF